MKFVFLFLTFSFIAGSVRSETIVSGRIINSDEEFLYYTSPVDNFSGITLTGKEKLHYINKSAKFLIHLTINSPLFIKLQIGMSPIWLLIEPNDSLEIEFNYAKAKNNLDGLVIRGNNKEGNLLYNKNNRNPIQNFYAVFDIFDKPFVSEDSLLMQVKKICRAKANPYITLYNKHLISESFLKLMVAIIQSHQLKESILKIAAKNVATKTMSADDKHKILEGFKAIQSPLDTLLNKGFFSDLYQYFSFTNDYVELKNLHSSDEIRDSILFIDGKELVISRFFVPLLYVENKKIKQDVWGKILYQTLQLFNDKIYQTDFAVFKSLFPDSEYNLVFDRIELDTIKDGVTENKNIVILDSVGQIEKIDDIVKYNLGKIIYVDLWASWCAPCRQEFIQAKKIEAEINDAKVTRLYISFDEEYAKANWIHLIYKNNLDGYHIFAGPELKREILHRIYKSRKDYSIPRYFILTGSGKILNADAYRPSDGVKLINQLKKSLKP